MPTGCQAGALVNLRQFQGESQQVACGALRGVIPRAPCFTSVPRSYIRSEKLQLGAPRSDAAGLGKGCPHCAPSPSVLKARQPRSLLLEIQKAPFQGVPVCIFKSLPRCPLRRRLLLSACQPACGFRESRPRGWARVSAVGQTALSCEPPLPLLRSLGWASGPVRRAERTGLAPRPQGGAARQCLFQRLLGREAIKSSRL